MPNLKALANLSLSISVASHVGHHGTASHIGQGNHNMTDCSTSTCSAGETGLFIAWYKRWWALSLGFPSCGTLSPSHHSMGLGVRRTSVAMLMLMLLALLWITNCRALILWVPLSTFSIYGVMAKQTAHLHLFWSLVTFCNSQWGWSFFAEKEYLQKTYNEYYTIVKC